MSTRENSPAEVIPRAEVRTPHERAEREIERINRNSAREHTSPISSQARVTEGVMTRAPQSSSKAEEIDQQGKLEELHEWKTS